MKKIMFTTAAVLVSSFIYVQASSAQLINYNRRNKNAQKVTAPVKAVTVKKIVAVNKVRQQVRKIMDPKVVSRVEKIYDINSDGWLQSAELKEFYGDVIKNVNRRGSFGVSDGVLKKFDVNDDDRISRYEIGAIERAIR